MIGQSLLHYEITEKLGQGGMGEVFKARDTKLGRDVALKILPADLSGDPEREARFQREARALASLQHANVASVYGFEEAAGKRFLVMELISGSELTVRMGQGPVPVDEARTLARQIAAGLEAAHEAGIVHRDLKPANVMETAEGEVKILDFGLAQAWFGDSAAQSESAATPTITAAMTQMGTILGTAAYMSPEQARGAAVDRRADIWAFGVILYEMLTGKRLFEGETMSDTLAAVLRADPEWDELPVDDAPELCRLIERCLVRDPKQRLRDIGEARIFLQDGGMSSSNLSFSQLGLPAAGAAPSGRGPSAVVVAGIAAACLAVGAVVGWQLLATPEPAPLLHTMIPAPRGTEFDLSGVAPGPAVISPDGTRIAFTAVDEDGTTALYLRHLDEGESVRMSGTEGAAYPFWSADGTHIGFFDPDGNKLKKVAADGGPPVTLCTAPNGKGGDWSSSGTIIFAPDYNVGIHSVPDIGGEPVQLTNLTPGYDSHRHPRFLPGEERFLFVGRSTTGSGNTVFVAGFDSTVAAREVATSQANADFADGHLLTVREGVLMATPFSPDEGRVTAGAAPLVESIVGLGGASVAIFSASANGMMVFQTGVFNEAAQLLSWADVETGALAPAGEPGQVFHPFISPDGTQALLEVRDSSNEGVDLWLMDTESGLRSRFTFQPGDETRPVWSASGESVFYSSVEGGVHRIMEQPVEGQGGAAILVESESAIGPTDTDPSGRYLLYDRLREDGNFEMRRLDLQDAAAESQAMAAAGGDNTGGGEYSPDGRWIAYHTETAAGWDIFVIPADGGVRKWQVSTFGAAYPVWAPDGKELWCSGFNGEITAFAVEGTGATFRVRGSRTVLTTTLPEADGRGYDLHPDGTRILQAGFDPSFRSDISHLHLVTDWKRGLMR